MATSYVAIGDLEALGIRSSAIDVLGAPAIERHLSAASRTADGYLSARYTLPLVAWEDDLREIVVAIAQWRMLTSRGFNPEAPGDVAIRTRFEDAMARLKEIANGVGALMVTESAAGSALDEVEILTSTQRGWSSRGEQMPTTDGFTGD